MDRFSTWLDTMLDEKGIDLDRVHEIEGPSGANFIPLACVVEAIKGAGAGEQ